MRLFRKIRKKLLISGKVKSYLIYALGEILLIVIGVLIAWKINNLNELRKNRIVELKIYKSLNEELNANMILLDASIASYSKNRNAIENTIEIIMENQRQELVLAEKKSIINVDFKQTQLHNGAVNSINTTNKFEFIESDLLKDLIAAYPNELDNFQNQETKIENIIINRLQPVIEKHISLIDILTKRELKINRLESFSVASNYSKLLKSREYQNCLVDRLLQTEIQLTNAINLRDKTQTIAYNLTKELEN
ncbi:hypothetical protein [uncultured Winogradskyella sp.]|uniref:hypothetical protein n=1 Tax=uncultured Winogradskyella sp. TaxID=395353 RepID=UPI0026119EBB|nr:hypothetical protein [uncultured Winogradskyella sp.]|tara:strand:- start:186 stop:938 length:753 start_codon:yes stop_codon:yes gene_type:complete